MSGESELLHASCVSLDGKGVLLFGPPGSGKSDLALRLIDSGGVLVADDQVFITAQTDALIASPPEQIAGLLEMRGVGIFQMGYVPHVPLVLAVQLVARTAVERMPPSEFWGCLGLTVPLLSLHAFDSSICAKIRLLLKTI